MSHGSRDRRTAGLLALCLSVSTLGITACHLIFPFSVASEDSRVVEPVPEAGQTVDVGARDEAVEPDGPLDTRPDRTSGPFCAKHPAAFYCNDFDISIKPWVPTDEYTVPGYIDATAATWGGSHQEYWSPDLGDGDRALTFYRSSSTSTVRWKIDLVNNTGAPITKIILTYDLEAPWVRFQGTDPAAPEYNVREAVVAWFVDDGTGFSYAHVKSPTLSNEKVTASVAQKWLESGEMDALQLRMVDQGHVIDKLQIAPGQPFALALGRDGYGGSLEKHINIGVDNLVVNVSSQ
jgi:hypothetical protein